MESIQRQGELIGYKLCDLDDSHPKCENVPELKIALMNHQKIIARFMSSRTPYNGLLLIHEMGSGKTCSAIGVIEQIRSESKTNDFQGAIIFGSGKNILANFPN